MPLFALPRQYLPLGAFIAHPRVRRDGSVVWHRRPVAFGAVFLGFAAVGIAGIVHEAVKHTNMYDAGDLLWALSVVGVFMAIGVGFMLRTDRLVRRRDGTYSMRTWRLVVPVLADLDRPEVCVGHVRATGGLLDSDNSDRHASGPAVVIHDTRRGFVVAMNCDPDTLLTVATDLRDRFGIPLTPYPGEFAIESL